MVISYARITSLALVIAVTQPVIAGEFAASAIQLDTAGTITKSLKAPDGKQSVVVRFQPWKDSRKMTIMLLPQRDTWSLGMGLDSELIWAPDSSAFAITTTNTSSEGPFDTFAFAIDPAGMAKEINVSPIVRKRFGHPVACAFPEEPNIVAVGFTEKGDLLVAAQIMTHTVCDSRGTFRLYEVELPSGEIVREYDQLQAKQEFGKLLGSQLSGAPDKCITSPRRCWLATNHPGANLQ